jgi:hypothetical protein
MQLVTKGLPLLFVVCLSCCQALRYVEAVLPDYMVEATQEKIAHSMMKDYLHKLFKSKSAAGNPESKPQLQQLHEGTLPTTSKFPVYRLVMEAY